jgi:hypothetical protein
LVARLLPVKANAPRFFYENEKETAGIVERVWSFFILNNGGQSMGELP